MESRRYIASPGVSWWTDSICCTMMVVECIGVRLSDKTRYMPVVIQTRIYSTKHWTMIPCLTRNHYCMIDLLCSKYGINPLQLCRIMSHHFSIHTLLPRWHILFHLVYTCLRFVVYCCQGFYPIFFRDTLPPQEFIEAEWRIDASVNLVINYSVDLWF